jgi:hypothetical protein
MSPGQTAFTRIPAVAYSRAAVFVSPTTPFLLAFYAAVPLQEPTNSMMEAVLTMVPLQARAMEGATASWISIP